MSEKKVKISVEIPAGVRNFYTDLIKFSGQPTTMEEILGHQIVQSAKAVMDSLGDNFDRETLLLKYGLQAETEEV
jgi:hypothetical protein